MPADPADLAAKVRRDLGLTRQLEQPRLVLSHPSRGGSRGYDVWYREEQLALAHPSASPVAVPAVETFRPTTTEAETALPTSSPTSPPAAIPVAEETGSPTPTEAFPTFSPSASPVDVPAVETGSTE